MNKIYLDNTEYLNFTINQNGESTYYLKPVQNIDIKIKTLSNIDCLLKLVMVVENPIKVNIDLNYEEGCHSQFLLKVLTIKNGSIEANLNSIVGNDDNNVKLSQNTKVINIGGARSKVSPNLLISNPTAIANHGVVISNIEDNDIYYLMSKGLTKAASTQLIINGFIESADANTKKFFNLEG